LIVAAATAADGWRVTYVGPGVPPEDVADTLAHLDARVLILSLAAPPGDREIPRELRRLRALLPARVALLVVAAAAAAEGWRVTYVGSRVPADDVVDTLEHLEAPLLVLSLAAPPGDREVPRELRRLRAMLPAPIEVLVVGSTADVHRSSIVDTGAIPLGGLTELRAHLRERHAAAPGARQARAASRRRVGAR